MQAVGIQNQSWPLRCELHGRLFEILNDTWTYISRIYANAKPIMTFSCPLLFPTASAYIYMYVHIHINATTYNNVANLCT